MDVGVGVGVGGDNSLPGVPSLLSNMPGRKTTAMTTMAIAITDADIITNGLLDLAFLTSSIGSVINTLPSGDGGWPCITSKVLRIRPMRAASVLALG